MLIFVAYCAAEFGVGNWGASYLVETKGLLAATAGTLMATYFAGITIGRILSGFISFKFSNNQLIMMGITLFIIATVFLFIKSTSSGIIYSVLSSRYGSSAYFPKFDS